MKIGISYDPFDRSRFARFGDQRFQKLRACGFEAVDYGMANTETPLYRWSEDELNAFIAQEKQALQDAGLTVSQVHGPWRCPPEDATAENRAERLEKMRRSMHIAAMLGCENWVVHPLMPCGVEDLSTGQSGESWRLNVEFLRHLLQAAEEYGVTICLENMPFPAFSLSSTQAVLKLVEELDSERLKICLDTGHAAIIDGTDLTGQVQRLAKKLRVLHVHDNMHGIDLHLPPFAGHIEWAGFARALRETGFSGVFSLEADLPSGVNDALFEQTGALFCRYADSIINS